MHYYMCYVALGAVPMSCYVCLYAHILNMLSNIIFLLYPYLTVKLYCMCDRRNMQYAISHRKVKLFYAIDERYDTYIIISVRVYAATAAMCYAPKLREMRSYDQTQKNKKA